MARERNGNAGLIEDQRSEEVDVLSEQEVAELIDTNVDDLSWLPYGSAGIMYMARSKQLDDGEAINRNATAVAKRMMLEGMNLGVRGAVVVFPAGVPWGPLPGDGRA